MFIYKGIRGLAQAFVRSAAERKLGANATYRLLREAGLGYRRTNVLSDYRQYEGIPEKADRLRYVPRKYTPSRELYTETTGFMKSMYRYQIDVTFRSGETGEILSMKSNVSSDVPLTIGEAEEIALGRVSGKIKEYAGEVLSYRPTAAFHYAGELWE